MILNVISILLVYFIRFCYAFYEIRFTFTCPLSVNLECFMKLKIYITSFLLIVITSLHAQVGIGTTSPNASSMLDITSTNSGLLIPRIPLVSATDLSIITSPITSLLVYNSGFAPNGYYYWNGSIWVQLAVGSNTDWSLTGNTGTSSATNFFGTTDDVDIVFKRFNVSAGYIGNPIGATPSTLNVKNTIFGANSLLNSTTGYRNTVIGSNVMTGNTSGSINVAIGDAALASNTSGIENTAVGVGALFSNASNNSNTAIGRNALTTSTADFNTAVGDRALTANTLGTQNTAIGVSSLRLNTQGNNNTASGVFALRSNTIGNNNTALGYQSFYSNSTGGSNVGLGYQAGYNETGSNKLYIANTNADASNALIYGEFDNKIVRVNGTLQINNPASAPGYSLPIVRGTNGQVLQTNGAGATSWASASSDWSITGNSGLSGTTNFLGTTDAVDVAFRRSNLAAGKLSATSTSFGVGALSAGATTNNAAFGNNALTLSTGTDNVAVGLSALAANTTGTANTALGKSALAANSTGAQNTAIGSNALALNTTTGNTAMGYNALTANVAATGNTAVGFIALTANNTGGDNTAVGYQALKANTGGFQNTSVGVNALERKTTGSANTAIGHSALNAVGTFNNATAVGYQALLNNTSSNITAVGFQALMNNSIGTENTAIGYQAGTANTTGTGNTALGYTALTANNSTFNTAIGDNALGRNTGSSNTAVGYQAEFGSGAAFANTTAVGFSALFNNQASNNTAVGYRASNNNTSGASNTAIGYTALNNNFTGGSNTALGHQAGFNVSTSNNTLIGFNAGQQAGANNTAVGANALSATTGASNSVAIGFNALVASTAANNTSVGYSSLSGITTGARNVALGYQAGSLETTANDKLYISNSATTPATSLIYGEFSPARILRTNSTFQIGDPAASGYFFPTVTGSINQVLQLSDNAGTLNWVNPSALSITETDPQVTSTTTNYVPRWNGTTLIDGVIADDGTNVGIGIAPSVGNKLDVSGKTRTTNFQMTNGATANYVLQSDATGNASWVNPTTLSITETDPQVSSTTSSVVPKWNGTTLVDGIMVDDGTNVGVGIIPSAGNKLEVNGKTKTTDFQMTTGATANYVLQSDATGNASWALPNNTLSVVRTNLSAGQSLGTSGWEKLNFDTVVFDINTEYNTGTNRFVATKAGYYEVNAGYHTDNQGNTQFYSIGVYKNGALYQQTTGNHYNVGYVSRNINCIVYLNAGQYIEIFAENYQSGVTIDSFPGKTFFEVKQIR